MKKIILSFLFIASIKISAQDWTWLRGNSTGSVVANYGSIGVSAPTNDPGSHHGAGTWTDASGNLWEFGGEGFATAPAIGWLNDMWKYNPATNEWTWIRGANVTNQNGKYGTIGVSSPTNEPGAREFPTCWKDNTGNFWMFGGDGWDAFGTWGRLNDLWKYDLAINEWTWINGSNLANQNGAYGTLSVSSPTNIPGGRHKGGSWVDASNNFWMFGGYGYPATGSDGYLNDLWKYDPSTNEWTWVKGTNLVNQTGAYGTMGVGSPTNIPGGREFPAVWRDPSGVVWMFGGGGFPATASPGHLNDMWHYNQVSNVWVWISGTNSSNQFGNYGTLGVPSSTNNPGGRYSCVPVEDNWGNLWLFGGIGLPGTSGLGRLNDLFRYTPSTNEWTWMKGFNGVNANGTYGTMGVSAPANNPGGRYYNIGWKDLNGDMWIFGSFGYPASGPLDQLNDLWKFKITCAPYDITDVFSTNICNGNSTILSVATISSTTVNWYSSSTSTTSLGTGNNFNTGTLTTGNYTFYAEGSSCPNRAAITVSVSPCTNVMSSRAETFYIRLLPNPNNGSFFIKSNLNEAIFTLHNTLGQEIFKKEISKGENYLEMNVAKGIYYYFIEEKNMKVQSGKMVVE
jgi:N-acetylneuraminic acid mutarotase